ncbi:MAG TPA: serine/threonine-protein kinase [Candidatus Angelobacter sp.]
MATCSSCGSRVSDGGHFCSACGAALASDDLETIEFASGTTPSQSRKQVSESGRRHPSSSGSLLTEGRFLPGRLIADRYRIIALLGRGGMGEVYRADDLTLGQPVALKFLPEDATKDETVLERFRNEVRISRRVSHPNVCRVYDVGDVEGHAFYTMEYVDGEDLASLLRRIGRLPADKALEIARQLCAGLAAAHAKGVLHRDLKPANIMLDGRGQVVITDFGLAGFAEQIGGADVRSGTPAYMSPEQLAGKEVTVRSDIYSLGLVLYEIFTGKRAFDIESLPELVRARTESEPSKPSTLVKDVDPAVERVILRCLETEPSLRPSSVLNVAAALPGGDPLAAALAAGETPSPQMVAAAGEGAGLAPRTAIICLIAAIAGLSLFIYLTLKTNGMGKLGLERSPEILSQKAQDIAARLGYEGKPLDTASRFYERTDFLNYVQKNSKQRSNWDAVLGGRPGAEGYWYRQSPQYMIGRGFHSDVLTPGIVTENDPPEVMSGMISEELDAKGRLQFFQAIPPEVEETTIQGRAVDWNPLFEAAGLNPAEFTPATPTWNSLASSDARAAWTGKWPETEYALRIEAAAFHGKPVFFYLIGPWTKPGRMPVDTTKRSEEAGNFLLILLVFSITLSAIFLARRNSKQGRGDKQGASRLANVVFVALLVLWLCQGHLVPSMELFLCLVLAVSLAFAFATVVRVLYLSLEPYVRRHWPQTLISWSRLLMGQVRDPLVGRDIVFGVILGAFWLLLLQVRFLVLMRMGAPPTFYSSLYFSGMRMAFGAWLLNIPGSIQGTLLFFFLLFVLRVLLRREWLAGVVFVALWVTLKTLGSDHPVIEIVSWTLLYSVAVLVVFRVGFIALAIGIFVTDLLVNVPLTLDFSVWYAPNTLFPLLSVVALLAWGFYHSLAGRKLWNPEIFG